MLSTQYFIESLRKNYVDFFTGVPDSLLKDFCACLRENVARDNNIIAANEGNAIGLATGYYLATNKIPVVYMQNSGLGNCVNPLMSLTATEVYNIPMILLIGWRGEPGVKDEPQHIKQGKVTLPLLEAMGIKYAILSKNEYQFDNQLHDALNYIRESHDVFAFIVQKNTFEDYKPQPKNDYIYPMSREKAIRIVASLLQSEDVVVSTTGMISRELYEYRETIGGVHDHDFLTVGAMGHASQIALGIALQYKDRNVYCFDGDGAMLMHMGALAITGNLHPVNYKHIVFNNGAHDSVGGQPTVCLGMDITGVAVSCGYKNIHTVSEEQDLKNVFLQMAEEDGPCFLEIKVSKGARKDLGRPAVSPIDNKKAFMKFLKQE